MIERNPGKPVILPDEFVELNCCRLEGAPNLV